MKYLYGIVKNTLTSIPYKWCNRIHEDIASQITVATNSTMYVMTVYYIHIIEVLQVKVF